MSSRAGSYPPSRSLCITIAMLMLHTVVLVPLALDGGVGDLIARSYRIYVVVPVRVLGIFYPAFALLSIGYVWQLVLLLGALARGDWQAVQHRNRLVDLIARASAIGGLVGTAYSVFRGFFAFTGGASPGNAAEAVNMLFSSGIASALGTTCVGLILAAGMGMVTTLVAGRGTTALELAVSGMVEGEREL